MASKREAFRKYLEKGNVIETLNRAMIALNEQEDPPETPLGFIREVIGAQPCEDVDSIIRENQDLNARVIQLRHELALLQGK